jgi:LPXTG-site transpeptidase (sortase) family protein
MPPRDAQRARRRQQRKKRKPAAPFIPQHVEKAIATTRSAGGIKKNSPPSWIAQAQRAFARARSNHSGFQNRWLPLTCILLGSALLTYVVTQYAEMYRSQKNMAAEWTAQQRPSSKTGTIDPTLTRLTIPKINLDSFVVEGTSHKALLHGPGHLKNSAEPGQPGNVIISAHRDTFFRHVFELETGDQVQVERAGKIAIYEVTGKKVVDPDDFEVLRQTKEPRLTLITCYPTYYIGPAPQRAIVIAKLVSLQDSTRAAASTDTVH